MVKIIIVESLFEEIEKKFKGDSIKILELIESLKENPKKGKEIGTVGGVLIKELRYQNFRFYFITDGFKIKYLGEKELIDLLLKFVRISDKKYQQETINKIKNILKTIGPEGFN